MAKNKIEIENLVAEKATLLRDLPKSVLFFSLERKELAALLDEVAELRRQLATVTGEHQALVKASSHRTLAKGGVVRCVTQRAERAESERDKLKTELENLLVAAVEIVRCDRDDPSYEEIKIAEESLDVAITEAHAALAIQEPK